MYNKMIKFNSYLIREFVAKAILLFLTFFLISSSFGKEIPEFNAEKTNLFIKTFLLAGPFPNPPATNGARHCKSLPGFYKDYLEKSGSEISDNLNVNSEIVFVTTNEKSVSVEWKLHEANDKIIDLDKAVSAENDVLCYALCNINSAKKKKVTLGVGANNGVRVWLNGKEVIDNPTIGSLAIDSEKVPVTLKKGSNQLLAKIEEGRGNWQLAVRLKKYNPDDYCNKNYFQIQTDKNSDKILELTTLINAIPFKKANFILRDINNKIIWEKIFKNEKEIKLPINKNIYSKYQLEIFLNFGENKTKKTFIDFTAGPKKDYFLFKDGKTDYEVVINKTASETEKHAASVLTNYLRKISDAIFPLIEEKNSSLSKNKIFVGYNKKLSDKKFEDLDEGFKYLNSGNDIVIWGGKNRGTMYGVFTFLEKELGVRWLSSKVKVVPKRSKHNFSILNYEENPAIKYRLVDYYDMQEGPISAPQKNNSLRVQQCPPVIVDEINGRGEQPGGFEKFWFHHSFDTFVPVEEYFEKHPEYFSLIHGKRQKERSQLCLSNPEVLEILITNVRKFVKNYPNLKVYNIGQNDNHNPCQCEKCQEIVKKEGAESGIMLWFVNQAAERLEKDFPNKIFGTYAYQFSRKPPKTMRPRKNVAIILCSIECDFSHPLTHEHNKSFVEELVDWGEITDRIFIWDYVVGFSHYLVPFPNFDVLQTNILILKSHNVQGICEQANCQNNGGEFFALRAYILAKLLWNPNINVKEHIDDFINGYYGRSASYIREYFKKVQDLVTEDSYISIWTQPNNEIFTDEFMNEATKNFEKAKKVAETDEIYNRVEVAELGILYLKLTRDFRGAIENGVLDRIEEITKRENIYYTSEGTSRKKMIKYFRDKFGN